jgi:putative hydrolase of the HAD superfamily
MKEYRYFLIDIDRTLWDFDTNSEHAIWHLIERHPHLDEAIRRVEGENTHYKHLFFERYDVLNHKLWAQYESGALTKEKLRWYRFYTAFELYGLHDEEFAKQFGDEYLAQMICEKELIPGAREMLAHIESLGGKMAVLSNGFKEVQYHKLERSGIRQYFSEVVISEEVGYQKPDPNIFRIALERLCGFTEAENPDGWQKVKDSAIMIGDDPANDIVGAMNYGIDQFFYNPKGKASPGGTYESESLILPF